MAQHQTAQHRRQSFGRDALISGALVLLALGAFDDITTDNATSFIVERLALTGCAVWFLTLSWRLIRQGRAVLGAASIGFVAIGVWGQTADVAQLRTHSTEYAVVVAALAWFLILTGLLGLLAWRAVPGHAVRT